MLRIRSPGCTTCKTSSHFCRLPAVPCQSPSAHAGARLAAERAAGKTRNISTVSPGVRQRSAQSGRAGSAARAGGDERQAAADEGANTAALAAWDDGWGGPLEFELQEDPAAEIWFDYEVRCSVQRVEVVLERTPACFLPCFGSANDPESRAEVRRHGCPRHVSLLLLLLLSKSY